MHNYINKIPIGDGKYIYLQNELQKDIATRKTVKIINSTKLPSHFYHFRKGGHISALLMHQNFRFHARLDLKRFYYQVTRNKIVKSLKKSKISFREADEIASLSTVRTEKGFTLPFGFHQSPFLAAICLHHSALGRFINSLVGSQVVASVYGDDIIISSNFEKELVSAYRGIIHAASESKFDVNKDKSQDPRLEISAFNIDISHNSLKISEDRFFEMKLAVKETDNLPTCEGIALYVKRVNDDQYKEICALISSKKV